MNFQERMTSMVTSRIKPFTNRIKKLTDADVQKNKLATDASKGMAGLFRITPENSQDYYPVFGWLVSKRLAMAMVVSICILCVGYIAVNAPQEGQSTVPYKAYRYNSLPLKFVTDKVQILGKSGYCAYIGDVENGMVKGIGTLYNPDGEKVYEGSFDANAYNGEGKLYYPGEILRYDGEFSNNLFHGEGQLYRENGSLIYEGEFLNGLKEGEGVLYNASGKLIFQGNFSMDQIRYSDFLGKTSTEISRMYQGNTRIYITDEDDYNIFMQEIHTVYGIMDGSNSLDEEAFISNLYVLNQDIILHGTRCERLEDIREVLGEPIYEGNTALSGKDQVVLNLAIDQKGQDILFGRAALKETSLYDDVIQVEEPVEAYLCYWYVFQDEGIVYTFFCKDKEDVFSFYMMEQE